MKKEEMKGKVKEFTQKHKKGLQTVAITGLAVSGVYFGWKLCDVIKIGDGIILKSDSPVKYVLEDVKKTYKTVTWAFGGINDNGLKPEQLGELGEAMINGANFVNGETFTHFIAIGPDPTK